MKHELTLPSNMIHIDDLTVTQNSFRHPDQIQEMVRFVASNGRFNIGALATHNGNDLRLINIVRFEDGRLFIHDGHHRIAAVYLGGRKFIYANEYQVTDWKYEDYLEINLDKGWITPFDPKCEVRKGDYSYFKYRVKLRRASSDKEAIRWIRECQARGEYSQPRTVLTIRDLVQSLHSHPEE